MADLFYCNKCGNFTDASDHRNADGGGCQYLGVLVPRPDPELCPRGADKPEATCTNRHQCWEPCGELGKDERFVRVAAPQGDKP